MKHNILLSVVIPTRNRSTSLSALLDSLFLQAAGSLKWEILVIDNASTDDTRNAVQEKITHAPIPIRYIYEEQPGLHHGRHRGTHEAEGEIVSFLDDDTVLDPQWISGVELIQTQKADAVVSRILPKWEEPPPGWLTELITDDKFSYLTLLDLGDEPRQIEPVFVWGASFFIRRSLVYELGGFHPDGMPSDRLRYRGDGELGFFREFQQQGYRAWYDPRSVAYHTVSRKRMTLDYLCQRSYNEGISDSYTQIREDHALYADKLALPDSGKEKSTAYFIQRAREMSPVEWLQSLQNRFHRLRRRLLPTRRERILHQLQRAHDAGWKFHQMAVQADPELLDFVLKKTYMD